jgi:hypothetical protein
MIGLMVKPALLVVNVGTLLATLARQGFAQVYIIDPTNRTSHVNEGGRLTLVCMSPLGGAVDWLHNGVPLPTSMHRSRYSVQTTPVGTDLRHVLTIGDVRLTDAGTYTCRQMYTDQREITVDRLLALQMLEPRERSLAVDVGDNVTFVCLADTAAVIAWYRSDELVTRSSPGVSLNSSKDYDANRQTARLTLTFVTPSASGDYQCRDQIRHITDSRIVRLNVVTMAVAKQATSSAVASTLPATGFLHMVCYCQFVFTAASLLLAVTVGTIFIFGRTM